MVQNKENKSELLRQLKIDKDLPAPDKRVSYGSLLLVALVSLAIGGAGAYFLMPQPTVQVSEDVGAKVTLASLGQAKTGQAQTEETESERQDLAASVTTVLNASGYITPRLVATVSAEVMGLIVSVDVEEGMAVESGQILAKLDDSVVAVNLALAQARVDVQVARLKSIQADQDEAKRVYRRISSLQGDNFSSEAQFTRAQANVDKSLSAMNTIKADIALAKLHVEQQREFFENHTIRAPFAGVVTVKNAQPGEIVSPSSAGGGFTRTGICTIVDMNSLEIEVDVNESFIRLVYPGQKVVANLDAYPKWDIPASVIAIIPAADRAKATVRVRIKIEALDPRILPDMGVKVALLK